MFADIVSSFVASERKRPLSVVVAIASVIAPGTLIIFLARPALFWRLGMPSVVAMSAILSLPLFMIAYAIVHTPLSAFRRARTQAQHGASSQDLVQALNEEDALEWPCFYMGAWLTTVVLYVVAAVAYVRPFRIGATFLLIAGILAFVLLVVSTCTGVIVAKQGVRSRDAG